MHNIIEEILVLLRGAWRHRKYGIAVAWTIAVIGVTVVGLQKDVYEASARVYVNTASQLRVLLGDQIVDSNVEEQLRYVRETLLGRPQMERIARHVGLIGENETPGEVIGAVGHLSSSIQIISSSDLAPPRRRNSARTDDTYFIRYQHNDRNIAIAVVDKLLTIFVEDTLGGKQTSSRAAGIFLSEQIEDYKVRLVAAESALAEFNRSNFDRLPGLQGGYFRSLQTARDNYSESTQALELAESRLQSTEKQMRGESPRVAPQGTLDPNSIEARILEADRNLDDLRLRYTDQHPDVAAAREISASLKARLESMYGDNIDLDTPSNNPVFQALQISRHEIKAEIAVLNANNSQRRRKVIELEGLIGEMPEVEAELVRLNRDYDVIRDNYQALVNSLERENLSREVLESEEMEFRVIEPPSADLGPVAPRRALLTVFILLLSVGSGLVTSYILSQVRPVFDTISKLQSSVSFPIIGTVSYGKGGIFARSTNEVLLFVALAGGLIAFLLGLTLLEVVGPGLTGIF